MAMCPNNGNPDRHDHANGVTKRSRASICQRTVGEHLSAFGGFITPAESGIGSVKRPVRTRMMGVVGLGD